MHRDTCGTGRRNTEPNIFLNTFFTDPTLGKDELKIRIDTEIRRVSDDIFKLVMQRTLLMRRRNAVLSPAVNLPPELLALIFEHACSPNNGGEYEDGHHPFGGPGELAVGRSNLGVSVGAGAVTPLFLGSICYAWRRISQNTSQLWDTLTVCVKNNRRAASQAALLRAWLKRSGQRPLTIKLLEDDFDEDNDNGNDIANEKSGWGIDVTSTCIIDVLASHSTQWHTVDMFLPSTWRPALSKIKRSLPLLTSLTLRASESCPTLSLSRLETFVSSPLLREVRLVGYSVSDVLLPWGQIKRLDGEYFSPGECLDTLHRGTSLKTCQVEQLFSGGGIYPFMVRPIRHECLESFELIMDMHPMHELHALFDALTLPNLTELVLSLSSDGEVFGDGEEESVLRPVIPLMKRSGFKLQRLHLVGVTPSEEELIGFLKQQPTLKALLLINPVTETGGTLGQRFVDAMMPTTRTRRVIKKRKSRSEDMDEEISEEEPDSYLVPMLEHLEYQGPTSFSTQALTELLVNRWRVGKEGKCDDKENNEDIEDDRYQPSDSNYRAISSLSSSSPPSSPSLKTPTSPSLPSFSPPPPSPSSPSSPTPPSTPFPPTKVSRSQLHSVIITTTKKIKFNYSDAQLVQGLIAEGMHLDFLADLNGPAFG